MRFRFILGAAACLAFLASAVIIPAARAADPAPPKTQQPAKKKKFSVTYKLSDGNEKWPADKRQAIIDAMDKAVALYNDVGEFDKHVTANYSPGTPTADANYDGWMNFGGSISYRVALHELGHCMGVGTTGPYHDLMKDGVWQGKKAQALVRKFDGKDAVLHGDRQHFWPYGLNYDKESSPENDRRHVQLVQALRADMKIINGK